ncbi:cytidylyltransferase domain-containing protein [Sulfurovum sp.]|uniref:cytidylyltransferase domain-containing protein n=1 Tax=Sulfurovum sp. TaxID=1969726 RepID=UPI0035647C05
MKRKIVALLQARTDSTRLPRKVLKPLLGEPMIIQELLRVQRSLNLNQLVLLTSSETSDDELAKVVSDAGFSIFRGSKDNVLERFYKCAQELNLNDKDVIVRLTGDCPVHDAVIIDELINAFLDSDLDYMANCVSPIYPDGLDTEVFTFDTLEKAYNGAKKLSEKEHVTPYIRESGLFKTADLKIESVHPEWRLTVDEPTDFMVIEKIYNHFGSNAFSFTDVVSYIEKNPSITEINSSINRNEGYLKSLEKDRV